MKIALYIAFNNSSSVNCCMDVIDIVSAENDIIIDSKIKSDLSNEFHSKFSFFDSSYAATLTIFLLLILAIISIVQFILFEKRIHYR